MWTKRYSQCVWLCWRPRDDLLRCKSAAFACDLNGKEVCETLMHAFSDGTNQLLCLCCILAKQTQCRVRALVCSAKLNLKLIVIPPVYSL